MRVFILSMQRSGTRSLTEFLLSRGMSVKRHPWWDEGVDYQAQCVDREDDRETVGRIIEPVVRRYRVLADVPIPVLGKRLARRFPEARFVLLRRPADDWIASLRRHHGSRDLTSFERVVYWTFLPGRPKRLKDIKDIHLRDIHDRHLRMVKTEIPPDRLLVGDLYDPDVGRKTLDWLGLVDIPPFPHANRSAA